MSTTVQGVVEREDDRAIEVRRTIDAPRARVFEAWTDVRHISRWWGPHGFSTTTKSFEFRPEGTWEFTMHGPDGTDFPNLVQWQEIERPARLVYRQGTSAADPHWFTTTVTFLERDGKTEIVLRSVFVTKALRDEVVEKYGAIEGGHDTLERFSAYVAALG